MKKSINNYHCFVVGLALLSTDIGLVSGAEVADVTVNGRSLCAQEIKRLETQLGTRVRPGDYFMNVSNLNQAVARSSAYDSKNKSYRAATTSSVASR